MLKKLLTGCLTIAMAAAMALPAMAADVTVGGRAHSSLMMVSVTPEGGDGYSYMNIESEGRIQATGKATEGDWTFSGSVELRSNFGTEAYSGPVVLQKYFQLENDQFALAMGTKWFGFAYLTPFIGLSDALDRECYGCADLRSDRISFKLKEVGLEIVYGVNNNDTSDSTGDGYTTTNMGLAYMGAFGPVNLAFVYVSSANSAVENQDAVTADSDVANMTTTNMALMVQYAISEAMWVEFDYDSTATVSAKDADPGTKVTMGLAFSMALSEAQGFTFVYDMITNDNGVPDDTAFTTTSTIMDLYFTQKIGGGTLFAGYESKADALDGEATLATTVMAVGGRMNF
jgi:hypothetical protein